MTHVHELRLQAYALDELPLDERLEVEQHIERCDRCRARLELEQQLDEWILASSPPAPTGSAERALANLWKQVDAPAAPLQPAWPSTLRRLSPWWPALAAAACLWLLLDARWGGAPDARLNDRAGDVHVRGAGSAPAEHDGRLDVEHPRTYLGALSDPRELAAQNPLAQPPRPPSSLLSVRHGEALDTARLAEVRERVAAAVSEPDSARRDALLDALRREGWPVATHLRALALGDDEPLALAALVTAAEDRSVLAAVVEHPTRGELVLTLLLRDPSAVEQSVALRRALERRAQDDDRSLEVLGLATGPRSRRALQRVVSARLTRLQQGLARDGRGGTAGADGTAGGDGSADAGELPLHARLDPLLAWLEPVDALDALLELRAERGDLAPALEPSFLALSERARQALVSSLVARLEQGDALPPRAWLARAQLVELVPTLLLMADAPHPEVDLLDTLVTLGGGQALLGLHELWEGAGAGAKRPELSRLATLLARPDALDALQAPQREALLAGLERHDAPTLETLLDALPPAHGGQLVLALLARQPTRERGDSRSADLLMLLARHGTSAQLPGLVSWLTVRDGHAAAPLGWAVGAHLDAAAMTTAWAQAGHDPAHLDRAARSSGRRLASAQRPSHSTLAPLGRTLRRAPPR